MTEEKTNIEALAQKCIAICEEKKAANIVLFDVRENSELAAEHPCPISAPWRIRFAGN